QGDLAVAFYDGAGKLLLKLATFINQREPVLQLATAVLILIQRLQLLVELTLATGLFPVPLKQVCFLLLQFLMLMLEVFAFCLVVVLPTLQPLVDERAPRNDPASDGEALFLLPLQFVDQCLLIFGGSV